MPDTFTCSVVTPEEQVHEGPVSHVVLPAWDGEMGFAINRAPILVQIGEGRLRLTDDQGQKISLHVAGGFAQMKGNVLTILADRVESPEPAAVA